MKRGILLVTCIVVLLLMVGLGYSHLHKPSKHTYNPMAFAPVEVTNILYDNHISDEALEPQLTYWVEGECPNCRILQVEAPLHINNATYLGFFNLTGNSLRLVPANESNVREYLEFFREHGGKAFPCNSTAIGRVGNSTFKVKGGICVVPAVVNVGG
ncbi:hypothetical protein A3L11_06915 [Thermococcus siculi]|uniref:Uncharacterized protein n=1 Tax=Thermococcus siculi TaxID=72803 RepID=A0A2Z2MYA5_9EURY|nr:hypothetical protein [Thermococcus siculi]ASJ08970.1 hypothetical protein A3L11_06915 [Thermococcus siculi]